MSRLATRVRNVDDAELWNTMLLLLPGSISVYYGDEIGMTDSKKVRKGRNEKDNQNVQYGEPDSHRTPMQWSGDEKNAGFTEGIPYLDINDDYKERNFYVRLHKRIQ